MTASVATTATSETRHDGNGRSPSAVDLHEVIHHAAHFLPSQNPITVFVHHNTCHAYESLHFSEAVIQALKRYGYQPYWPEDRFRDELDRGRIRQQELEAILLEDLGEYARQPLGSLTTRFDLRLAMLQHRLQQPTPSELHFLIEESQALRRFRNDTAPRSRDAVITETRHWVMRDARNPKSNSSSADRRLQEMTGDLFDQFGTSTIEDWSHETWETFCLQLLWRVCRAGVEGLPVFAELEIVRIRHRDLLLQATGEDTDRLVHEMLIPFCSMFLDQGLANWPLPDREKGFLAAFQRMHHQPFGPPARWRSGLARDLDRVQSSGMSPLESIAESLTLLGVTAAETEEYLTEVLLALPGWTGMLWMTETNGDLVVRPSPPGTLEEFLAIRLILERLAVASVARDTIGYAGPLNELRDVLRERIPVQQTVNLDQRAFVVFQLAQVMGWSAADLYRLSRTEWSDLVQEIEVFSGLERRRVFQSAYERRFRNQTLDALAVHTRRATPMMSKPSFQIITCIDDREESFRRHLEELDPDCETFGAAGFFAVVMYYRGAADAHYRALCPNIIKPQHYVMENVLYTFEESHRRRKGTRRALGTASLRWHVGSRSFLGGILTALFGSLASIPMVTRILFPRTTAQIREMFGRLVQPPPATQLKLERSEPEPGPTEGQVGYTVEEMTNIVERILRDIGLLSNFGRLVIFAGHGSSSMNNPQESAYNCGACAGGRGGPNARAFAQMANDVRVRERLEQRELPIPDDTIFIGCYHNTCDEDVVYYDLDRLPFSHRRDFEQARERIDRARELNAHERCRRFESAELTLTPEEALHHVESRAEDLSQARPEYNHATNAWVYVGRRWRTRNLFCDRRVFLASYDPTQDDDQHSILLRILTPAVPVCAGISLEYYFSTIDNGGWGAGSKLPYNVASMLGVMEGAASDLRPGLNQQMIEIHEPMRAVFVVETQPEVMVQMMDRNKDIGTLCRNDWVQVATLDPDSDTIHVFHNGRFELYTPESHDIPIIRRSADWYRGWRDNLGFASIDDRSGGYVSPREHLATARTSPGQEAMP